MLHQNIKYQILMNAVSAALVTTPMYTTRSYKYIGHIITDSLSDEDDIKSKEKKLYCKSNILLRKFHFCSDHAQAP